MESLFDFFISNAYAAPIAPPPAGAPNGGFSFIIMIAVFIIFIYFGVWRPQSKRAKEQQSLLSSLTKGDEIVSAGGFLGRITKLSDQYVTVALANNVEVILQKSAVISILPKGTLKSLE